jgi:hypothetical protein
MAGQATFSLADEEDLAGSAFLAAGLSLPAEPLLLEEESLDVVAEDSLAGLSLTAVAAELEPFLLSVR